MRLAAEMIFLGDQAKTPEEGYSKAKFLLTSGQALEKFEEICRAQGGDLSQLPFSTESVDLLSQQEGYISTLQTEKMGLAAIELGAGRLKITDPIDPAAGIFLHQKVGSWVRKGERLATLYSSDRARLARAEKTLASCYEFSLNEVADQPLIHQVLGQ